MPAARSLLAAPTGVLEVLDIKLVAVGGTTVTLATAVSAVLVILFSAWLAKALRRMVRRVAEHRGLGEGTAGTVGGILYYIILVTGFGVALQTIGIDLAALFAAGAIFAIGIGFAMQNIAQNFVSGVILLTERAIKPGDVVEVEGNVVKVQQMGIRATIVQTRDGEEIIVPNSILAQSSVKNYTLENSQFRLSVSVGVVYSSDLHRVRARLEEVAQAQTWRLTVRDPEVFLSEFGDNSVVYEVLVWMSDPWRARAARSALHEAIWWAFKEERVVIAFPQLDLHLDEDIAGSLRALGGRTRG